MRRFSRLNVLVRNCDCTSSLKIGLIPPISLLRSQMRLLPAGCDLSARRQQEVTGIERAENHVMASLHYNDSPNQIETLTTLFKERSGVETLVAYTTSGSRTEVAIPLLVGGASTKIVNNDGMNALHDAAECWYRDVVKMLLFGVVVATTLFSSVADAKSADWRALSRFHSAASEGDKASLTMLLNEGVDVNVVDNNDWTALHHAAKDGHQEIVAILLKKGARVNCVDKWRWSPLQLAAQAGHEKIVKMLLDGGANAKMIDKDNVTELHYAAAGGYESIVLMLPDKRADVKSVDKFQVTALHYSAKSGQRQMVELLLNKGADLNGCDDNGWTALHYALAAYQ